jgi:hypothetical protein
MDGATSIAWRNSGVISLMTNDVRNAKDSDLMIRYCLTHQEYPYAKFLKITRIVVPLVFHSEIEVNFETVPNELQIERADLQFDKDVRNSFPYIWVIDFYKKYLPADDYPVHTISDMYSKFQTVAEAQWTGTLVNSCFKKQK